MEIVDSTIVPKVSICIVNWNSELFVKHCVESITCHTKDVEYEIIIVDNASPDGSGNRLKKDLRHCSVLSLNSNRGFSAGNNAAVTISRGEYLLFLNPDTLLIKGNPIYEMARFLDENSRYGAVGCRLLNEDGTIQLTCARSLPTPFNQFCQLAMLNKVIRSSSLLSTIEMEYWDHKNSRDIECISGACIMSRRTVHFDIGGYDERYYMYTEDVDYCYKIAKNGYKIHYLANPEIVHLGGKSSDQVDIENFALIKQRESTYKYMRYHFGIHQALKFRIAVLVGAIVRLFIVVLGAPVIQVKKGYKLSFLVKRYGTLVVWAITAKTVKNCLSSKPPACIQIL